MLIQKLKRMQWQHRTKWNKLRNIVILLLILNENALSLYFHKTSSPRQWEESIAKFVQNFRVTPSASCPVSWGCRIHRLLLCRGVRPPPHNGCPGYDTKQSDGEVPAMLELWGMRSTPLLPSLPGPLWPGVVAPDKGPIYGSNRTKPCFLPYTDFCI